jgi:hypothetical protein
MRLYYLERRLEAKEVDFVANVLKLSEPIEQIHIPYVLPASDPNGGYRGRPIVEGKLIEHHLLKVGILLDRGKKICLVIPKDSHWHQSLIAAISKLTGCYPSLIQTDDQRKDIDNPGDIRIVDMEELIGRDKTEI